VVLPGRQSVHLPCTELPELVSNVVNAIIVSLVACGRLRWWWLRSWGGLDAAAAGEYTNQPIAR
jgi:hypothetical protein